MMVGKRFYSEADMMRMQRNAEERVREMQERARTTAQNTDVDAPPATPFASGSRNWSTNPNQNRRGQPQGGGSTGRQGRQNSRQPTPSPSSTKADPPPPPPEPPQEKGSSTILDDVVNALGLESDTLLIVGLILILINQKADTTLILALVYLLF